MQINTLLPQHFGGPDSREQLRVLDTYSPMWTCLALPNPRCSAWQTASQVSRSPNAPHIQVFLVLTAYRLLPF